MQEFSLTMDLHAFQEASKRTQCIPDPKLARRVVALGLISEPGEIADLVKKHLGQGHPLDRGKLIEEAGDCLFYLAWAATLDSVALEEWSSMTSMRKEASRSEMLAYLRGFALDDSAKNLARTLADWGKYGVVADALLYLARLAAEVDATLDEVADANVEKLRRRFPEGWSPEADMARVDTVSGKKVA